MFGARTGLAVLPPLPRVRASRSRAAGLSGQTSFRNPMEAQSYAEVSRPYHHYQHTQPCKYGRWTARECYEFMYSRPWEKVNQFYLELVNDRSSLSELVGAEKHGCNNEWKMEDASHDYEPKCALSKDRFGRWARLNFQIVVSYSGNSFDGWQKQPGLNTVQGLVERSLGRFVDDRKAEQLRNKGSPIEGMALVAGRTDKGVSALSQVCSFYTWRKDVNAADIKEAIDNAAPGKLKAVSVFQVSRAFHPNFSAKWRRYLYIFPFNGEEEEFFLFEHEDEQGNGNNEHHDEDDGQEMDMVEGEAKPRSFSVPRVNQLLQQLEGKMLSYKMFARDTKASRNEGPPTECFLYHARAAETMLPCLDHTHRTKVMYVELVANRFLRKMVRVLVATAIREAASGAEDDILISLMDATCRRATAPPAPPDGLCLVDVGYTDFDTERCFIKA